MAHRRWATVGRREPLEMAAVTEVKQTKLDALIPDHANANKGTERGRYALEASLRQYGAGRSILLDKNGRIIAGNKTAEVASDVGIEDVVIVQTDGKQIVAVQRTDLDIDSEAGRGLAYADNRVGELSLDWDADQVLADINAGVDLSALFRQDELDAIINGLDEVDITGGKDEPYSREIKSPVYEPKNEKPVITDLFDDSKTKQLIAAIDSAVLPEDVKEFLRIAAQRHTVLRFNRIADFYAHSDAPTQRLMEDSALVIIDFKRAIELGFVRMTEQIAELVSEEYE